MTVGLKESIPCDQVISRNNNHRNYLNECRGTHFIFYLLEGSLFRETGRESFKPGQSLNFSPVKRGAQSKGAFIQARVNFQIIVVMLRGLEMSYLNALMPGLNCSRTHFITSQEHKEKVQKFANRPVINICFDNNRNLSADSVMKDKVRTFKKDEQKNNSK